MTTPEPHAPLRHLLSQRFAQHPQRHAGCAWGHVEQRLLSQPKALRALAAMEASGGEPDVIGLDPATGQHLWADCAAESPTGRRRPGHHPAHRSRLPRPAAAWRVRPQNLQLGGHPARRARPRRRPVLRPPLRPRLHVPQRRAVVLRGAGVQGVVAGVVGGAGMQAAHGPGMQGRLRSGLCRQQLSGRFRPQWPARPARPSRQTIASQRCQSLASRGRDARSLREWRRPEALRSSITASPAMSCCAPNSRHWAAHRRFRQR
ncbi:MAG: hypothetical protein RJA98_4185 [Pseudomonadota bacterium]